MSTHPAHVAIVDLGADLARLFDLDTPVRPRRAQVRAIARCAAARTSAADDV